MKLGEALEKEPFQATSLLLKRQLIHIFFVDFDSQKHYRNNIDYCL